jgi:hypothetical protein
MSQTLFNLPADPTDVTLTSAELAQVRYKLWKIQQRVKSDTTTYNQARLLLRLLTKAERRALRERKRRLFNK